MPTWATVLIALAVVLVINLLSARAFGEFEFWAAILKVGAIVVFLVVGLVVVIGGFDDRRPQGRLPATCGATRAASGRTPVTSTGTARSWSCRASCSRTPPSRWSASRPARWRTPQNEVPKAVNAVIFRIAIFYCGSILLLVCMLPTTDYTAGTSPFVTVFERLGLGWMSTVIQAILIVAAMSSLNSGLYSTGRVLRSLGMSKQAPQFTLKMSSSGVPWAGIVMTSVVFVFGAVLNALTPDAFEIALEAAAIGVILFTWAHDLRLPAPAAVSWSTEG